MACGRDPEGVNCVVKHGDATPGTAMSHLLWGFPLFILAGYAVAVDCILYISLRCTFSALQLQAGRDLGVLGQ